MVSRLLFFFLLLFLVPGARAASAVMTVTFDHSNGVDPSLEYVVEVKLPDGTFLEVAKGPASPLVYSTNAAWGDYRIRLFVRSIPATPRNVALDTSPEAVTTLVPGKPNNPTVTSNRSAK
jgi:hypothetical protein